MTQFPLDGADGIIATPQNPSVVEHIAEDLRALPRHLKASLRIPQARQAPDKSTMQITDEL